MKNYSACRSDLLHYPFKFQYTILHAVPPQEPPKVLSECKDLTNDAGFVNVHKDYLQHTKFPNVFAIGDCSSSPNSKTMAAIGNEIRKSD